MKRLEPLGIWEAFVPGVQEGCTIKSYILTEKARSFIRQILLPAPPSSSRKCLQGGGYQQIPLDRQYLDDEADREKSGRRSL